MSAEQQPVWPQVATMLKHIVAQVDKSHKVNKLTQKCNLHRLM